MKLSQISYFLRVCDTLNFTRAAEQCYVSQPSLSAAIHKLEEELGGSLFDRSGKQVALTALGEAMRIHLGRVEEAKKAATSAASAIVQDKTDAVKIGVMCSVNPGKLLPIYEKLGPKFRKSEISIRDVWEKKAAELLLAGSLDCLLMARTVELDSRFVINDLGKERMVLAMSQSHPFASRESVALKELQGENYIDRLRCEFREQFFDDLSRYNTEVQVIMRAEREDFVVDAVDRGLGITMMPEMSADLGGLATCAITNKAIEREICIVTVQNRPKPELLSELITVIADQY